MRELAEPQVSLWEPLRTDTLIQFLCSVNWSHHLSLNVKLIEPDEDRATWKCKFMPIFLCLGVKQSLWKKKWSSLKSPTNALDETSIPKKDSTWSAMVIGTKWIYWCAYNFFFFLMGHVDFEFGQTEFVFKLAFLIPSFHYGASGQTQSETREKLNSPLTTEAPSSIRLKCFQRDFSTIIESSWAAQREVIFLTLSERGFEKNRALCA